MWRRVEEGHREEHVVAAQLRHVVAKEVAVEALSEASILGLDNQGRVDGERGPSGHGGLLEGLCPLARVGLHDVLEVPRRDEEDADVREGQRVPDEAELVLGRDGR